MDNNLHPVYFFPGPEIGKKDKHIAAIRKKYLGEDQKHGWSKFYPYDTPITDIITLLENGSLFCSHRMVHLADAHALKPTEINTLRRYIREPSSEAMLVISTDTSPGSREYPKQLAEAIPKQCIEIFWEMFEKNKFHWVMEFFNEQKIHINEEAAHLLVDVTEGTTNALKEACQRICLTINTKNVDVDDVEKILEHSRHETIYSLFDRFCQRNLGKVLEAYHAIIHSDPGIADRTLMMMAEPLSCLVEYQRLHEQGQANETIARTLKIKGGKKSLQAYREGVRRYSNIEIRNAFVQLVNLEAWLRDAPHELRKSKIEIWFCNVING